MNMLTALLLSIPLLDAGTRNEVIDKSLSHLNRAYIFADKAKEMEAAVRAKQQKGEYDAITSGEAFAEKLTADLQAVSKDKHLRVRYRETPAPAQGQRRGPMDGLVNYGFVKVDRLDGNVGYLDLRGFMEPSTDDGKAEEAAVAAMNKLADADALIIDLRKNGGGNPGMIQLLTTYLYDEGSKPIHLNTFHHRERNETIETWTRETVPGRRFGKSKPVYVLTSNRTFSAAEEFTYNLRNLQRATVVGEVTGGGAHPGGMRPINDHFAIFVPTGRAVNPITKTNWEGVGVQPHIAVSKEEALSVAHADALKKLGRTGKVAER